MKCIDFQSPDISAEEYHLRPELSHSAVKCYSKEGPLLFHWQYILGNRVPRESTALNLGSAFHYAIEHPDGWRNKYVEEPAEISGQPVNRRLKAHREYLAKFREDALQAGKTILEAGVSDRIPQMLEAGMDNPAAADYLLSSGGLEVAGIAKDAQSGLGVRSLADKWIADWPEGSTIVDYKTTSCGTVEEWTRMAFDKWSYNFQAGFYSSVFSAERFVFLVFRSEPPYECWVRIANPSVIRRAQQQNAKCLMEIKQRQESGEWHSDQFWGAEAPLIDEERQ